MNKKGHKKRRLWIWILLGSILFMFLSPFIFFYLLYNTFLFTPSKWADIEKGMKKQEVVKKLGKPLKIYRRKSGQKTVKGRLPSYGSSKRMKANEIYVYANVAVVFYIYIDEAGKVIGWSKAGT